MLVFQCTEAFVRRCFVKKSIFENFTKLTGKHMCQSLSFNKFAGIRHRCFSVNFIKFSRTPFFIEHLRWLLLSVFGTILCITKVVQQIQSFFQKTIQQIVAKFLISLITKLKKLEFKLR